MDRLGAEVEVAERCDYHSEPGGRLSTIEVKPANGRGSCIQVNSRSCWRVGVISGSEVSDERLQCADCAARWHHDIGSKWLAERPLPPTLLALFIGIVLGPEVLNLINLEEMADRPSLLEKAARLTLGIVGVALRIPRTFPRQNWRGMLILIGFGMVAMWAITTSLVYLILGLPLWLSALVAAIVTPTDPVAASPIVTGSVAERNIPERVRHSISFESG